MTKGGATSHNGLTKTVRYRLLGPVALVVDGRPVDSGEPRRRAVLAALLADPGHVVPSEVLVERLWDESPPRDARGALRAHVAHVRSVLAAHAGGAPPRLVHSDGGYLLDVDPELVDLFRFRRLTAAARAPGCPADRQATLLREALAEWHGTPLAGMSGSWAARTRDGWAEERLDATVAWAGAELRVGNAGAVLGPLVSLVGDYPRAESLTAALMRVLRAAGRPGDALDHYARARARLAEELGTDPGPELQALHRELLRGEPAQAPTRLTPAQLPADLAGFVGREPQLAALDALLAGESTAVAVSAVSGTAGVGKTALAVHWAHRVAHRFPDGQLYVDLRGFDEGRAAVTTAEVVRGFLDALAVPAERIPAALESQLGLYRSVVAGRRMLILLDNARDSGQVRRLLPGTPTALVVVTSRDLLTDLVVSDGADPVILDVMTRREAREILADRLGAEGVDADPDATGRVIGFCAGLPLALSVVAARAQQTGFALAQVAAELTGTHDHRAALDSVDPGSRLRAAFSWSYAALTPEAAYLFRLLGLNHRGEISTRAAASLAAVPVPQVRKLLAELAGISLLVERTPGRWGWHDLVFTYAAELAESEVPPGERDAATERLVDHYLHTGYAADRLAHPARDPIPVPIHAPAAGTRPEQFPDRPAAVAWLHAEHRPLLAALRRAAASDWHERTWQIAWVLDTYLNRQVIWNDRIDAWHEALRAAGHLGEPVAEAYAHRATAGASVLLHAYDDADRHFAAALELYARRGDLVGQAQTHQNMGFRWDRLDEPERALEHVRRAHELYSAANHPAGEAESLNNAGWCEIRLGRYHDALAHSLRAQTLNQRLGNVDGEAMTWDTIGLAQHHLGQQEPAIASFQRAIDLFKELGARLYEAGTLVRLGDAHRAADSGDPAREAWQQALSILTELPDSDRDNDLDVDAVRRRLTDLEHGDQSWPPPPGEGQRRSAS
ncbi:SARP family transcriptional regulator [Asanoa ishikariensis]|uniref:DNA-binding transcriptional activator of the SARP family n=1 Tax=Asanoa ishikariensis TaxID=137265 RepID=A0A1H3TQJ9_9ACTN|nr:BTAD domain-containing putative transcriptional regulator [Asanoa ishikariensis]GIF62106.1 SARP family transcriptional regulator [Asanoa ishikariensis]SDZ51609.1 DNA-binding transcriptional activator of the SARP family [Asanoa ishikariensis]